MTKPLLLVAIVGLLASPMQAQDPAERPFEAPELTSVEYGSNGEALGSFWAIGDGRWQEYSIANGVRDLTEVQRDKWSVYLSGQGGDYVQLDLWTGKVFTTPPGQPRREQYEIIDSSNAGAQSIDTGGGQQVMVRFKNQTPGPIGVFWIDSDGQQQRYGRIDPNGVFDQATAPGHLWWLKQGGQVIDRYRANQQGQQLHVISLGGAPAWQPEAGVSAALVKSARRAARLYLIRSSVTAKPVTVRAPALYQEMPGCVLFRVATGEGAPALVLAGPEGECGSTLGVDPGDGTPIATLLKPFFIVRSEEDACRYTRAHLQVLQIVRSRPEYGEISPISAKRMRSGVYRSMGYVPVRPKATNLQAPPRAFAVFAEFDTSGRLDISKSRFGWVRSDLTAARIDAILNGAEALGASFGEADAPDSAEALDHSDSGPGSRTRVTLRFDGSRYIASVTQSRTEERTRTVSETRTRLEGGNEITYTVEVPVTYTVVVPYTEEMEFAPDALAFEMPKGPPGDPAKMRRYFSKPREAIWAEGPLDPNDPPDRIVFRVAGDGEPAQGATPPAVGASGPVGSAMTLAERDEMLRIHNEARARVNAPPVTWSAEIAGYAQQWADLTAGEGRLRHRPAGSPYGENIAIGQRDAVAAAEGWRSEISKYNGEVMGGGNYRIFGHYTQMVWSRTTRIGCGKATTADGRIIWVCNYDPPGNMTGQKPY